MTRPTRRRTVSLRLTGRELAPLVEALDSHVYWQLSDEHYRNSGFVDDPGADDPEIAKQIEEANALLKWIEYSARARPRLTRRRKPAPLRR